MRVDFSVLDVFAPRPYAGNRLCVVRDAAGLDDAAMQAIALEIGFAESTFVTAVEGDRYHMRIFTPDAELPFAGHPTLGTTFHLVAEGALRGPDVTAVVPTGEIPVHVDLEAGRARMRQLPPTFDPPFADRADVARACLLEPGDLAPALPVQVVSTGLRPLIVPIRDLVTLRRAERDGRSVREVCAPVRGDALYLFALDGGDIEARMFDVGVGIGEDPATGSAAGPLGAYLAEHGVAGMPGTVTIHQGAQVLRPSELLVEVWRDDDEWVVEVEGGVHRVGGGWFDDPERGR